MNKSDMNVMTEGPIWKKIVLFALPIMWGNLFQQLYNIVDSLIVGNFLGKDALAAVSSSGSIIFLLVGLFSGIFIGAGVVISRYYGAKDYKNMSLAIHTSIAFALISGFILTVVGILLVPLLLQLMKTPESVLPNSILYFRIYFGGVMAVILYNTSSGIFQAVGDSKHPLYYLIISSITNVVLDLLFVAVLDMGIAGAGYATVISQCISALLGFIRLSRLDTVYRVNWHKITLNPAMLKQILSMGIPSGLQNSIISIANIVVQSNINAFGAMAVAGCGAYSRIEGFGFLPITSFALSMTTFIGQNLGAKKYDRAKKGSIFGIFATTILAEAGWPVDLLAGSTADLRIQPCTGGYRIRNLAGKNCRTVLFPACILTLYRRNPAWCGQITDPYAGYAVMLVHHPYYLCFHYYPICSGNQSCILGLSDHLDP